MMKFKQLALAVAGLSLLSGPLQAEILGFLPGRSAALNRLPQTSVEAGLKFGDYDSFGARLNYKLTPVLMAFGDINQTDVGVADGTIMGVGAFYWFETQQMVQQADLGMKVAYHIGTGDLEFNEFSIEALASGREPVSSNGLSWYGNIGYHSFSDGGGSEIGLGGGVVMPLSNGEAYVGLELIDDVMIGLGYRHFLY